LEDGDEWNHLNLCPGLWSNLAVRSWLAFYVTVIAILSAAAFIYAQEDGITALRQLPTMCTGNLFCSSSTSFTIFIGEFEMASKELFYYT
jgi:hypothetical protein